MYAHYAEAGEPFDQETVENMVLSLEIFIDEAVDMAEDGQDG